MPFFEEFASSTDADRQLLLHKNGIGLYQLSHYQYVCSGDHIVQGVMDIQAPSRVLSPVVQAMLAGLQLSRPLSKVLNLGLGCAAIERYLYTRRPELSLVTVDCCNDVIELCAQAGLLPDGCTPVIGDATQYLMQTSTRFDAVFCDLAIGDTQPEMLFSEMFYKACYERMNAGAVLMVDVLCEDNELLRKVCLAARKVFAWTAVVDIQGFDNVVMYAAKAPPAIDRYRSSDVLEAESKKLLSRVQILP
ncbi:MAG: hypothetical protein AAF542_15575 [Pseudomonadota bacterium]